MKIGHHVGALTGSARARFMIETLNNLKSGKGKAQSSDGQAAERMKKFLSGLGRKRRGGSVVRTS